MTKKSIRRTLSLMLIALILLPTFALCVSDSTSIVVYQQPKTNWCWVMCGVAIYKYRTGNSMSDSQFAYNVQGSYDNNMKDTADVYNYMKTVIPAASMQGYQFTWSVIKNNIDNNKPLYTAVFANYATTGHVVASSGYVESGSTKGVYFEDPAAPYGNVSRYSLFSNYSQITFVNSQGVLLYNEAGITF
jgi:hypothetical protein